MGPPPSRFPPRMPSKRNFPRATASTCGTFFLLVVVAGCDGEGVPPATLHAQMSLGGASRAAPFQLERLKSFEVEENDAVVNVTPALVPDRLGGLLVVDGSEAQVRRYTDDGRLLWHAGRRGQGPGEFTSVTAVGRLNNDEVVAGERNGRLTFFDSAGQSVVRTVETRLTQVEEVLVVDDTTLLLSGVRDGDLTSPRLHLWSTTRDAILHSFFSPFSHQRNTAVATIAGYTKAAVRGSTIAAVFGASDSVYLFTLAGRPIGQPIPFPSRSFRPAPEQPPQRTITNPVERARWISTFDLMADVEWLSDGTLLVAYQSIDGDRALTRRWHLLGMTLEGGTLFEERDLALLLGADDDSGRIYLVNRDEEAPNRWSVARPPSLD